MGFLREFEARVCTILVLISFTLAIVSLAIFTDPAFFTLFVKLTPAICEVAHSEILQGASKCNWTSCRQSYTQTIYNCTHILINYTISNEKSDSYPNESKAEPNLSDDQQLSQLVDPSNCCEENFTLPLYVNILGWGYEPQVSCKKFFLEYADFNDSFRCQLNLDSEFPVAVPDSAIDDDINTSIRSLFFSLVPLAVCIASCAYIRLRKLFKQKPKEVLKLYVIKQNQNDGEPKTFYERRLLTVERLKKKRAAETPSFDPDICVTEKTESTSPAEKLTTPPGTPKQSNEQNGDKEEEEEEKAESKTTEVVVDIVAPLLASVTCEPDMAEIPLSETKEDAQPSFIKLPEPSVQAEVNDREQFL